MEQPQKGRPRIGNHVYPLEPHLAGTPAQCTIDCAAAYGEFFSGVGKQNLTAPEHASTAHFVQTADHGSDTSRVLLKCYAECGASQSRTTADASPCTMDCALRHLHVAGSEQQADQQVPDPSFKSEAGVLRALRVSKNKMSKKYLAVDLGASWSNMTAKLNLRSAWSATAMAKARAMFKARAVSLEAERARAMAMSKRAVSLEAERMSKMAVSLATKGTARDTPKLQRDDAITFAQDAISAKSTAKME